MLSQDSEERTILCHISTSSFYVFYVLPENELCNKKNDTFRHLRLVLVLLSSQDLFEIAQEQFQEHCVKVRQSDDKKGLTLGLIFSCMR